MSTILTNSSSTPLLHITSDEEEVSTLLAGPTASTMYNSASLNKLTVHSTLEVALGSDSINVITIPNYTDQLTYFTILPGLSHNEYITKHRMLHTVSIHSNSSLVINSKSLSPISRFMLNNNNNNYISQVGDEVALASLGTGGSPNNDMYIGFNVSTGFGQSAYTSRSGLMVKVTWYNAEVLPDSSILPPTTAPISQIDLSSTSLRFDGEEFDSTGLLLVKKAKFGNTSANYNMFSNGTSTTDHSLALSNSTWPFDYPILRSMLITNNGIHRTLASTIYSGNVTTSVIGGSAKYKATYNYIIGVGVGQGFTIPQEGVCVITLAPYIDGTLAAAVVGAPILKLSAGSADGEYTIHRQHSSTYIFGVRIHAYREFVIIKSGNSIQYTYKVDGVVSSTNTICNVLVY